MSCLIFASTLAPHIASHGHMLNQQQNFYTHSPITFGPSGASVYNTVDSRARWNPYKRVFITILLVRPIRPLVHRAVYNEQGYYPCRRRQLKRGPSPGHFASQPADRFAEAEMGCTT
jgi:hypothetical protein